MTGNYPIPKRKEVYEKKRIFFQTPQTLENDLAEQRYDGHNLSLIIFGTISRYYKFLAVLSLNRWGPPRNRKVRICKHREAFRDSLEWVPYSRSQRDTWKWIRINSSLHFYLNWLAIFSIFIYKYRKWSQTSVFQSLRSRMKKIRMSGSIFMQNKSFRSRFFWMTLSPGFRDCYLISWILAFSISRTLN